MTQRPRMNVLGCGQDRRPARAVARRLAENGSSFTRGGSRPLIASAADSKKCRAFASHRGAEARGGCDALGMLAELGVGEACAVCGRVTPSERVFGHVYEGGERRTLCCVRCAESYLRGANRGADGSGGRGFIEEFLAAWRWRELGR